MGLDDSAPPDGEAAAPGLGRRAQLALAAIFAGMAALAAIDLAGDLREGTSPVHVVTEGAVVAVGLAGLVWMLLRYLAVRREARRLGARAAGLAERLAESRAEATRWRQEAAGLIGGLAAAIDAQLERWGLSPAEKDIALLLLKGLAHKEIAELRGVGEATVRQQARSVYKKAGLSGRADLAAFFLEDLLGPRALAAPAEPPSGPGA